MLPIAPGLLAQAANPKPISPAASTLGAPDGTTTAGLAWQRFLSDNGGTWWSQWCAATGTPKAIYGSGLALVGWRDNTLDEARRWAGQLLREQADLLGVGASELRENIGDRMGQTWVLVYDQYFNGLQVVGGRADVRVHMVGRVPMFGSTLFPIPANFNTTPAIGALEASRLAWAQLGFANSTADQPGKARQPRLLIWGDVMALARTPVFLAWEIPVSNVDANGDGRVGRYYIDANNGAVLHYTNDKHQCGFGCSHDAPHGGNGPVQPGVDTLPVLATGTVMAWTRTGLNATSPLVNIPVAGLEFNVPGVGMVTTDASGNYSVDIAAPVSVTFDLNGIHNQLIAGGSAPSVTMTLNGGANPTVQFLNSGANSVQAAHTTTFHYVHQVNEYIRSILGNTVQMATADLVLPTVNIASTCNAYYTNNTINFYAAGGSCNNTGFSTVVTHEWGHGLDDRYGGISNQSGDGLSEGWGDIIAMYQADHPIVGDGFYTNGGYIRNGNNATVYPPPAEVHAAGEVWMGFAWILRDHLATTLGTRAAAIALTDTIVIGSIVANAQDQPSAVREVYLADDNDGNLANGTPHIADLAWAIAQKNLPDPTIPGPTNDDCAGAIQVVNGINGTYNSASATTSSPAWPCGSGTKDLWFVYSAGTGTLNVDLCSQATWDTQLEIFSGSCGSLTSLGCNDDSCSLQSSLSVAVTPGTYYIRVGGFSGASGPFNLNVNGPAGGGGTVASATSYGTGCYLSSRAFYQDFGSAAAFDLNNTVMRLVRVGNHYVAVAAGAYVPPTAAATPLVLGDDAAVAVSLTGTLAYPGGTTNSLLVCSNGFVSVAAGNGTPFSPTTTAWLGSAQARWGTWHDFNPTAVGSGAVKFEQVGTTAYVTWDGVFDYSQTTPNYWQLQFDLATGDVTYAWQSMSGLGTNVLVGFAATAPNNDLGNLDLSVALPLGFQTGDTNSSALTLAGTPPRLGSTAPLTTTNYPAGSVVGVLVLSIVQFNPGIDLSGVGMPGCFRYVGTGVTALQLPVFNQSLFNLVVPNNPSIAGLPLNAQTYAFAAGFNPLGLVASNGMALVVGL